MDAPATVRVEERGGARGYRDGADEQRRVIHVRGSSPVAVRVFAIVCACLTLGFGVALAVFPEAIGVLSFFTVASFFLLPVLAPLLAWRRAQWMRLELERSALTVVTGPLGARERIAGWGARAPSIEERPGSFEQWFAGMRAWNLYAEGEHGRRVLLGTLYDEVSATWVQRQLEDAYRSCERP